MIKTVFVCGPTATGKTEYAIRIAQALGGEIVSADSMQIYKYMDIGSAKPTAEEQARAKHYLVDEIDPREPFNVANFQKLALSYIQKIDSEGKFPIVAGGTGLYVNSLIYDMDFSAPEGDNDYREEVLRQEGHDPVRLHERLRRLDPAAADEIHPNNMKRVVRAIERLEKGEEKIARFAEMNKPSTVIEPIMIGIDRDRAELYDRVNRRVDKLFDMGLEAEVRSLMDKGFTSADIAMKGIGYKEVIDAINSGSDARQSADLVKLNTRHLAKRQIIWLRRYDNIKWFTVKGDDFDENVLKEMLDYVREKCSNS